jgi:hypothetical protein
MKNPFWIVVSGVVVILILAVLLFLTQGHPNGLPSGADVDHDAALEVGGRYRANVL